MMSLFFNRVILEYKGNDQEMTRITYPLNNIVNKQMYKEQQTLCSNLNVKNLMKHRTF